MADQVMCIENGSVRVTSRDPSVNVDEDEETTNETGISLGTTKPPEEGLNDESILEEVVVIYLKKTKYKFIYFFFCLGIP